MNRHNTSRLENNKPENTLTWTLSPHVIISKGWARGLEWERSVSSGDVTQHPQCPAYALSTFQRVRLRQRERPFPAHSSPHKHALGQPRALKITTHTSSRFIKATGGELNGHKSSFADWHQVPENSSARHTDTSQSSDKRVLETHTALRGQIRIVCVCEAVFLGCTST